MPGFMSSNFVYCCAGFMSGFMSSKKPRFDRAKMQAGFPCNLPCAFAFLAQVENVLFENNWMGFHREQSGQVLAGSVFCSPCDKERDC